MTAAVFGVLIVDAQSAQAGGFTFPDLGTKAVGRGGAAMLGTNGPEVIYYNPALLTRLKGYNLTLDFSFHKLNANFTRAAETRGEGDEAALVTFDPVENEFGGFPGAGFFPEPMLFASADFGLEDFAFGAAVYGPNAAGGRRFPADGAQRYILVEANLLQVFYTLSAAYHWKGLRLGGSFQIATLDVDFTTTIFPSSGLLGADPAAEDPDFDAQVNLKVSGVEPTGVLGVAYDVSPALSFGLTYHLPLEYDAEGTADVGFRKLSSIESLDPLLSASIVDNSATLNVKQADVLRASARYAHLSGDREVFDLELTGTYERWSRNEEFRIAIKGPVSIVNTSNGMAFLEQDLEDTVIIKEWQDSYSLRLGGDYNAMDWLSLRAGTFYETAAVPDETTNLDFMSFDRVGFGLGTTIALGWMDIDLAYLFVQNFDRSISNGKIDLTAPLVSEETQITNNGDYSANLHTVSLGVTFHFDEQPVMADTPNVQVMGAQ